MHFNLFWDIFMEKCVVFKLWAKNCATTFSDVCILRDFSRPSAASEPWSSSRWRRRRADLAAWGSRKTAASSRRRPQSPSSNTSYRRSLPRAWVYAYPIVHNISRPSTSAISSFHSGARARVVPAAQPPSFFSELPQTNTVCFIIAEVRQFLLQALLVIFFCIVFYFEY